MRKLKNYHGTNNYLRTEREAKQKRNMFKQDTTKAGIFLDSQVDHKQF